MLSVRVLDHQGGGLASQIAAGIRYAADYPGVKIINLSLQQDPASEDAACTSASRARRSRTPSSTPRARACWSSRRPATSWDTAPSYPADYRGRAVGGGGRRRRRRPVAKFSRHGPWVDIAAPGVGVLTLATPCGDGNCWVTPDGTSFATPIVSAAAALVWAANPGLSAQQVAARLMSTADSVPGTGVDFCQRRAQRRPGGGAARRPGRCRRCRRAGQISATSIAQWPDGQGLLAGGVRRRHLQLRQRRLPRARPAGSPSTSRSSGWPPPRPGRATGWWRPTAASSPSATPSSSARPATSR